MELTDEQKRIVDDERGKVVRWVRHYWRGSADLGVSDAEAINDALTYAFISSRTVGDYLPEDWLLMHLRSAFVGDGSHLLREDIQQALSDARAIVPMKFGENLTRQQVSSWRAVFSAARLVKTKASGNGYNPEGFAGDAMPPIHTSVSDEDMYQIVLGYKA